MTDTHKSIRALVIAEQCNPEWVSVPLVGWSHYEAISKLVNAHLVTQVRNRPALENSGLVEGNDFTALDSERLARPLWRLGGMLRGGAGKGWTTTTALAAFAYYYFERLLWKRFGTQIRAREFDVVHRLTPLSPTVPSLLARKCARAGVPFVLGPLNGGVPWPWQFDAARRQEKEWLSYIRGLYKVMPGYRSTRKFASRMLIGSQSTLSQMPARYRSKCIFMPENGIDPKRFSERRTVTAKVPLRAAFVGRLVPYKGADMLLEALEPLLKDGRVMLRIIGDGPQREQLERYISHAGLTNSVDMTGWVDHERVQSHLIDCDLLTFPSIREFGGGVVLEAMGLGVVPVVVDYGGPSDLVNEELGFKVPLGSRDEIIRKFREVVVRLVEDPAEVDRMSTRAREVALTKYTWAAKAERTVDVYRSLIEKTD